MESFVEKPRDQKLYTTNYPLAVNKKVNQRVVGQASLDHDDDSVVTVARIVLDGSLTLGRA